MYEKKTCGTCVHYKHDFFYNWSTTQVPFITSMTSCKHSSDGYIIRGYNCVVCKNYLSKPPIPFFDLNEVVGDQLSLF